MLLHHCRLPVAEQLVKLFSNEQLHESKNGHDVLRKEALLTGLSVHSSEIVESLMNYRPLDAWLAEDILPQLNGTALPQSVILISKPNIILNGRLLDLNFCSVGESWLC